MKDYHTSEVIAHALVPLGPTKKRLMMELVGFIMKENKDIVHGHIEFKIRVDETLDRTHVVIDGYLT